MEWLYQDFSGRWTITTPGTYRMRLIKQRQRQGPIPLLNGPPVALDPLPLPIAISGDVCNNTNKTLDHAFVKASFGQPIKVVQHDIPSNAIDAAHASLSMYRISAETNMTVTKKGDLGDWIKNELSQEGKWFIATTHFFCFSFVIQIMHLHLYTFHLLYAYCKLFIHSCALAY